MGCHLVQNLLRQGHQVTIANRGITGDTFGTKVNRIIVNREDKAAMAKAFAGPCYDVVYDTQGYASIDIQVLLDAVCCKRYIQISSVSVYPNIAMGLKEEEYTPLKHPLKWCRRAEDTYDETKRQAEAAIVQAYPQVPSVMVRFPYVVGPDDYTKRLYFYAEKVMLEQPFWVDALEEELSFIHSKEAGAFLAWLADKPVTEAVNAASGGTISAHEILEYIEMKTNKKARLEKDGPPAPYNGGASFSLNTAKAEAWGYIFSPLKSWIYSLLDTYISQLNKQSNIDL